ncbi:MAG: ROK family protein [Anaerolineae bacterium]|nr:ROK family protein [Anaerolineae bacterium]
MEILGIDIGGTGIKGGLVEVEGGQLLGERYRVRTPDPSRPEAVAAVVAEVVRHFQYRGPVGCTFPSVIRHGVVQTAANVDKRWIGTDGEALLSEASGQPVLLLNDADAAGIAEMRFGAGQGEKGVVMVLTFGTGIGSAIFVDGVLLPNTELGHLPMREADGETWASDRARKKDNLKWKQWAERVQEYLDLLEFLFSPDLFIVGGGVSKQHEKFLPLLKTQARIVPAGLFNEAGIVGAALAAHERLAGAPAA